MRKRNRTTKSHHRVTSVREELLVCAGCRSRLVHPAGCEESRADEWRVELRCPDCGNAETGVFDLGTLDQLDRELDRAESEIRADLARLVKANMVDYVSRFVAALNADAIQPMDFGVPRRRSKLAHSPELNAPHRPRRS